MNVGNNSMRDNDSHHARDSILMREVPAFLLHRGLLLLLHTLERMVRDKSLKGDRLWGRGLKKFAVFCGRGGCRDFHELAFKRPYCYICFLSILDDWEVLLCHCSTHVGNEDIYKSYNYFLSRPWKPAKSIHLKNIRNTSLINQCHLHLPHLPFQFRRSISRNTIL